MKRRRPQSGEFLAMQNRESKTAKCDRIPAKNAEGAGGSRRAA